jgi:hypothetical protein
MTRFRPGQSGNPGGRPKSAHLSELARAQAEVCIDTLVKILNNNKAPAAARISAAKELLERGYGKVSQAMTLSTENDIPRNIQIMFVHPDGTKTEA